MMPVAYFMPGKDGEGLHEDTLRTLWVRAGCKYIYSTAVLQT